LPNISAITAPIGTPRQRVAVLAISRDDRVLGRERLHRAGRHRLFADVKVQKAVNLAEAVQLSAFLLEAPDAQHLAQERQRMVTLDFRLFRFSERSHISSPPPLMCHRLAIPVPAP
jgi:hypothetical protein